MAVTPISERLGRGGINNIRDRLLANESVDFAQDLGMTQILAKVTEMETENANSDPGDLAALFNIGLI